MTIVYHLGGGNWTLKNEDSLAYILHPALDINIKTKLEKTEKKHLILLFLSRQQGRYARRSEHVSENE